MTREPPASWVLRVQEYFSYQTRKGLMDCSRPTAMETRPVLTRKKARTVARKGVMGGSVMPAAAPDAGVVGDRTGGREERAALTAPDEAGGGDGVIPDERLGAALAAPDAGEGGDLVGAEVGEEHAVGGALP